MVYKNDNLGVREDKIENNSYNRGESPNEDFGQTMKVHDSVISLYNDQLGENIIENRITKRLENEIYEIFISSPYYEKYKKPKRADSNDRIKMFYYFKDKLLSKNKYSNKDIFIAFAEFFQINYDQLYSEISVLDKESLLKEMNENNAYSNRIKTKRLF
ncbi:hypothetical protein M0Q50_04975 [bacterium]|jgi:hypothetical protein|nr:hypothetical protein [bacterium]